MCTSARGDIGDTALDLPGIAPAVRAGNVQKDVPALFNEAIDIIDAARPRAVMIENVRGFLGAVFRDCREWLKTQLDNPGYKTVWRTVSRDVTPRIFAGQMVNTPMAAAFAKFNIRPSLAIWSRQWPSNAISWAAFGRMTGMVSAIFRRAKACCGCPLISALGLPPLCGQRIRVLAAADARASIPCHAARKLRRSVEFSGISHLRA